MTKRLSVPAICLLLLFPGCAAQEARTGSAEAAKRQANLTTPRSYPVADLSGLSGSELSRLLGSPGLLRRDGTAQVWQYVDATCILDLYLYASGGRHFVEYVEARAVEEGQPAPATQACLDRILAQKEPLSS